MDSYTIIEDIFGDDDRNQITAARGFVGRTHTPDDMKQRGKVGRVSERPDMPSFDQPRRNQQHIQIQQEDPTSMISPMLNSMAQQPVIYPGVDILQCRDVFNHVENCPICSSYFKKDVKFYWLIIAILVVVIILITKGGK